MRRLANLNPLRWGGDAQQAHNDVNLLTLGRRDEDGDERTRGDAQFALDLYLRDQEEAMQARFPPPGRGFARRELAFLRGWAVGARKEEVDYRPDWTHPGPAEAGFVYDFAPSEVVPDVGGKGKGKEVVIDVDAEKESVGTLLVCAQCMDPLLVRADGITDGGEEEVRRRKVWGLRCGHLIDGKCYEALRKPEEEAGADAARAPKVEAPTDAKGKGKGKAKARDDEDEYEEDFDELFDLEEDLVPNPIRSRLRPRALGVVSQSAAVGPSAFELAVPLSRPRKRAVVKRKGKAKPKQPVVEARHEWMCPVPGCGRLHASEKIDGLWVNPAEKGAVAVFV